MKAAFSLVYQKASYLSTTGESRRLVVDKFDMDHITYMLKDDKALYSVFLDGDFVYSNLLDRQRHIYLVTSNCDILLHLENMAAPELKVDRVATIVINGRT